MHSLTKLSRINIFCFLPVCKELQPTHVLRCSYQEEDREKTAWILHFEIPFGLTNIPALFLGLITDVLKGVMNDLFQTILMTCLFSPRCLRPRAAFAKEPAGTFSSSALCLFRQIIWNSFGLTSNGTFFIFFWMVLSMHYLLLSPNWKGKDICLFLILKIRQLCADPRRWDQTYTLFLSVVDTCMIPQAASQGSRGREDRWHDKEKRWCDDFQDNEGRWAKISQVSFTDTNSRRFWDQFRGYQQVVCIDYFIRIKMNETKLLSIIP